MQTEVQDTKKSYSESHDHSHETSGWRTDGSNWDSDNGSRTAHATDAFDPLKTEVQDMKESYWEEGKGNSTDESKDQMKWFAVLQTEVQDMKNILVEFTERMLQAENALLTAKDEARGAKERIVELEGQVTALREEIRELAAGRSNYPITTRIGIRSPACGAEGSRIRGATV